MKKIFLLSITSLAMLMADFTLEGSKLTPVSETTDQVTEPTTPPTTTDPVSISGVIPNSVDQIWADMNEPNTGWVSNMPSGWGQFQGAVIRDPSARSDWDNLNIWLEIEAAGDGSNCSTDINRAKNTRVEFGWTRGYILRKSTNKWEKFTESKIQIGAAHGSNAVFQRPCTNTYGDSTGLAQIEDSGFRSIYPKGYWRWHGWAPQQSITNPRDVKAIYGECYVRLIKDDPNGPDDRDLANFVAHLSSDFRTATTYAGDAGLSRYKKVTKDWVAINFLTKMTKAELEANPPPFSLKP
jgi:hypothetical protein